MKPQGVWGCVLACVGLLWPAPGRADSPFPSQQANPQQTGVADVAPATRPKQLWTLKLPRTLSHQTVQTVLGPGGKALYLTAGGSLLKVDAATGKIDWQQQAGFIGHPTIAGETLYVTGANFLRAYDLSAPEPKAKWQFSAPAAFQSTSKYEHAHRWGPTVVGELVLLGRGAGGPTADTSLHAVDLKTGKEAWSFNCKGAICSPVAVDAGGKACFFLAEGAGLVAVDLAGGKERWRVDIGKVPAGAGPAVADGAVYAAGPTELLAVSADDGKVLWRTKRKTHAAARSPSGHSAIVTPDRVVINAGRAVESYSRKDGSFQWTYQATGEGAGFMLAARDVLYVPDFATKGFLHAVRLADGEKLWTWQAPDPTFKSDYVGAGEGKVYLSTLTGNLYCLGGDTTPAGGEAAPAAGGE